MLDWGLYLGDMGGGSQKALHLLLKLLQQLCSAKQHDIGCSPLFWWTANLMYNCTPECAIDAFSQGTVNKMGLLTIPPDITLPWWSFAKYKHCWGNTCLAYIIKMLLFGLRHNTYLRYFFTLHCFMRTDFTTAQISRHVHTFNIKKWQMCLPYCKTICTFTN